MKNIIKELLTRHKHFQKEIKDNEYWESKLIDQEFTYKGLPAKVENVDIINDEVIISVEESDNIVYSESLTIYGFLDVVESQETKPISSRYNN